MTIHYLEIVTKDVDRDIAIFEAGQNLKFGDPVAALGGARVAEQKSGGSIGVRAPMHDQEATVARPYFLTDTINEAIEAAKGQGAEIALPPTHIEGHGTIAIYFVDNIQYGLWQL